VTTLDVTVTNNFILNQLYYQILNYSQKKAVFSTSQWLLIKNSLSLISTTSSRTRSLLVQVEIAFYISELTISETTLDLFARTKTTLEHLLGANAAASSNFSININSILHYQELLLQLGKSYHSYLALQYF
jgi:hypothetical protein